ncbi:MAG: hypothetical protein WCC50_08785 [Pseudolabrys sp.]
MDYELAKSLMDSGFPQIGKGRLIGSPDKLVWRSDDRVYVPTLEELIEACGMNFGFLDKQHGGWLASANYDQSYALRKPLPMPSPAYGSRFKKDDCCP